MSRKVNAMASAVVRRLKAKRKAPRRGRPPLRVAVASAVARRLAAPGKGRPAPVGLASAVAASLASKRAGGAKRRGRLSHPAARGPGGPRGVPPAVIASAVSQTLAVRSRRPKRKSLAAAVASAVARRLAAPGKRRR
jgi:hypothetical protein